MFNLNTMNDDADLQLYEYAYLILEHHSRWNTIQVYKSSERPSYLIHIKRITQGNIQSLTNPKN